MGTLQYMTFTETICYRIKAICLCVCGTLQVAPSMQSAEGNNADMEKVLLSCDVSTFATQLIFMK